MYEIWIDNRYGSSNHKDLYITDIIQKILEEYKKKRGIIYIYFISYTSSDVPPSSFADHTYSFREGYIEEAQQYLAEFAHFKMCEVYSVSRYFNDKGKAFFSIIAEKSCK